MAWKVCTAVVNCWLKCGVVLHDALHGFREGWGTGTATLEANMDQQLAGIAHKPPFRVFLDIHKAYDSVYRGQCLKVLRGYGMSLNLAASSSPTGTVRG